MYSISKESFGAFEKIVVYNSKTDNGFAVVPEFGANLLQVTFNGMPILDGHLNEQALLTNDWSKSGILFPFPNRLKKGRYHFMDKDYQFQINDPNTGNALHGFGMNKPFEAFQIDAGDLGANVHCRYFDFGDDPAYPFPFTFEVVFCILEPNNFEVQMKFINNHDFPIPVAIGWHPYFNIDDGIDGLQLQLPLCNKIDIDEKMIPTGFKFPFDNFKRWQIIGNSQFDDCFEVVKQDKNTTVQLISSKGKLDFSQETGKNKFNFIQLFTPPHRNSIAIEPMTGNIDAFNNGDGLTILEPDEVLTAKFMFNFTRY